MIRKDLAIALAMVVASGGTALAATSSIPQSPVSSSGALVVKDAPACGGKGFTLLTMPGTRAGYGCVHSSADPSLPAPAAYPQPKINGASRGPATAKVPCYGDGTTGPRIQMIYGYYDGSPNRANTVVPLVQKVVAPRMQAVINAQSLGKDLGLRFAMNKGCKAIDVKVIEFPREIAFDDEGKHLTAGPQLRGAAAYLAKRGMDRGDRKYQIMWDGYAEDACGIGVHQYHKPEHSLPGAPTSDGYATVGGRTGIPNRNNAYYLALGQDLDARVALYSMVFNHARTSRGPSCFQLGQSGASVEIHELFHTLGSVQDDAPHADRGHCTDAPSIMCSGNAEGYGLGVQIPACVKVVVETLDCGMDDYWNPSPEAGSYLSTHLNIAKSKFFGPQPQDLLVASPL